METLYLLLFFVNKLTSLKYNRKLARGNSNHHLTLHGLRHTFGIELFPCHFPQHDVLQCTPNRCCSIDSHLQISKYLNFRLNERSTWKILCVVLFAHRKQKEKLADLEWITISSNNKLNVHTYSCYCIFTQYFCRLCVNS